MKIHEIESWALNVIDQVNAGQPNEDQRVELKADWIDPYKAARRIAGHANAARGVPILWLIGVDEKRGVTGASLIDLASWYPQVESQFDDLAPAVTPVNVPVTGNTVVALLFETERAPFVVKVQGGDRLEVPWRGGTRVRSARRDELLRLLSPLQKEPSIQVLGGSAYLQDKYPEDRQPELDWQLTFQLYIVPKDLNRLVLPYHACRCALSFPADQLTFEFDKVWVESSDPQSTLFITSSELIAEAPGMFLIRIIGKVPSSGVIPTTTGHVKLALHFVGAEHPTIVETVIPPIPRKLRHWAAGQFRKEEIRDEYGEVSEREITD